MLVFLFLQCWKAEEFINEREQVGGGCCLRVLHQQCWKAEEFIREGDRPRVFGDESRGGG